MKQIAIIGNPLTTSLTSLAGSTAPTPKPVKPQPTEAQLHRLILNQVLVTMLESNTRILAEEGVWPSKPQKLVVALHHRVDELYERFFRFNSPQKADWVNTLANLSETAVFSLVALARQNNPEHTPAMHTLLSELARLTGVYFDDQPE